MNNTISVTFKADNNADTNSINFDNKWHLTLKQEYIPETSKNAEIGDLMPMWNKAVMGKSSFDYIYDNCSYVIVTGDIMTVSLDFFVYPSPLEINYRLYCDFGEISDGIFTTQDKSEDAILEGVSKLRLETAINGILSEQMPAFTGLGEEIYPSFDLEDGVITASDTCYTCLRVDGTVSCFRHTLTMQLSKTEDLAPEGARIGFFIENLTNSITAEWEDEDGEIQKTTIGLEIPPCVEDLLGSCLGDVAGSDKPEDEEELDRLVVYYNTCTGNILKKVVVSGEEK